MFPFSKNKQKKSKNFKIIDLTIDATFSDDSSLPMKMQEELKKRNLSTNYDIFHAESLIIEWEEVNSIKKIRESYQSQDWLLVISLCSKRIDIYPNEIESYIHKIRSYYMLEEWEECISICERLLEIDNENEVPIRFIARCCKNLGNHEKSKEFYDKLISIDNNDVDSIISLIRINYNQQEFNNVISYCKKLLRLEKDIDTAHLFLARSYSALNLHNEAIENLKYLYEKNSSDIETLVAMGRNLFDLGKYDDAEFYLSKVYEKNPEERRARRTLSMILDRKGKVDLALEIYRKECKVEPESFTNWEKYINLSYRMGNEEKVKSEVIDLFENNNQNFLLQTNLYIVANSFYWDKICYYMKNTMDDNYRTLPDYYVSMASNHLDVDKLSEAYKYFLKIDAGNPHKKPLNDRFSNILSDCNLSFKKLDKFVKNNQSLLTSEAAIICLINKKRKRRRKVNKKSKLKTLLISATLGRGGAERQVVYSLKNIIASDNISTNKIICRNIVNGELENSYYSDVSELGVEILEYYDKDTWTVNYPINKERDSIFYPAIKYLRDSMQVSILSLYDAFVNDEPDIVHGWQDQTNIEVAIAGLIAGVPGIVLFARSMRPDGKTMAHIRDRPFLKKAYNEIIKNKNVILCHNSNPGAESYAKWLGVDSSIFPVIHNAIDIKKIDSALDNGIETDIFNDLNIMPGSKIIGSVFRHVKEKRPDLWVNSVAKLIQEDDNVHAVIVGGGRLINYTKKHIEEIGLSERIHVVGQSQNIGFWLHKFDIFLLTSKIEGLPNVLIEAQILGVPVVSTDAGGAKDTIIDGLTGHIVEDDSEKIARTIADCLKDENWLNNAKEVSPEFAMNKFSQEKMIEDLYSIYKKSLNH